MSDWKDELDEAVRFTLCAKRVSPRRVTVHEALTSYSRTTFLKHFPVLHGGNPRVRCRIRVE